MTTATNPRDASRPPALRAAGALATDLLAYAAFWAGIVIVLLTFIIVMSTRFGDGVDASIWQSMGGLVRWVVLAGGVIVARSYVPLYVAYGITRRDALRGIGPVLIGLGLLLGLVTALGFAVEGVIYDALGWPHNLSDEGDRFLYDAPDQYPLIAVATAASYLAYLVAGAVAGAAFARWNPATAALLIPLAGLPVIIAELVAGGGWFIEVSGIDIGWEPLPALLATGLACLAGLLVAGAILRDLPLDNDNVAWWR